MWARATLPVLIIAAAMLGGCGAVQFESDALPGNGVGATRVRVHTGTLVDFNHAVQVASKGRYTEAAVLFEEVARQFKVAGDRKRAAEAVFWIGYCHEKSDRFIEAETYYRRVIETYPRQPAAAQSRQRLTRIRPAHPDG